MPDSLKQAAPRAGALCALLSGALALGACTTMGSGTGSESPGNAPVAFAWKSTDGGTSGTMSATLADGKSFSGPYLEITSQARNEDFNPMWTGWQYGWNDWGAWGPFPDSGYTTLYSGRVVANLQGPDAQRMRCRFNLNDPMGGMGGGGQGKCQLGGKSVDAVFPSS
jgi:hypothetical protein